MHRSQYRNTKYEILNFENEANRSKRKSAAKVPWQIKQLVLLGINEKMFSKKKLNGMKAG